MTHPINESKVTAVRLRGAGSRWHPVTEFHFFGDPKVDALSMCGATWITSQGGRCTVPQDAIYVCEGDWSCFESAEVDEAAIPLTPVVARPDDKLARAIAWLENALQDNQPQPTKVLRENARAEANISAETLDRAWMAIGAKSVKLKGNWHWQLAPMHETGSAKETSRQSELAQVEGMI